MRNILNIPERSHDGNRAGSSANAADTFVRLAIGALAGRLRGTGIMMALCGMLILIPVQAQVLTGVHLNTLTSPSSGATGLTFVNVSGIGFPSGTILPGAVTVSLSTSCGGSGGTGAPVTSVKHILGTSDRLQFQIPGSLADGTFFVSVSGATTDGDTFASSNCSQVQVTHSFAECPTGAGMSVVVSGKNVTAYFPNIPNAVEMYPTGINVIPIEGDGSSAVIPTPTPVIGCASNPTTGETVCVSAYTPDVYEITGTTITYTLQTSNPGNLGVAINPLTNMAVISTTSMITFSYGVQSIQLLDLSSNTFLPATAAADLIATPTVDPSRDLILSTYLRTFTLFDTSSSGALTEYGNTFAMEPPFAPRSFNGNPVIDCSTGIALAAIGNGVAANQLYIGDLTQATFTPPSGGSAAGIWIAPQQVLDLPVDIIHATGPYLSIAPGTSHLGLISAGWNDYPFQVPFGLAAIQLPSTSGSGIPTLVDYATSDWPSGFPPGPVTTYTSPNDGRIYGITANQLLGFLIYVPTPPIAVVDLQLLLDAPRTPGTHIVDPTYDLVAHGVIRFTPSVCSFCYP